MTRLHLMQFSLLPGFLLGLMSCADANLSSPQQADPEFRIYADLRTQQQADPEFPIEVREPVFGPEKGPLVCVDEAHNNVHTAEADTSRLPIFSGKTDIGWTVSPADSPGTP